MASKQEQDVLKVSLEGGGVITLPPALPVCRRCELPESSHHGRAASHQFVPPRGPKTCPTRRQRDAVRSRRAAAAARRAEREG